MPSEVKSIPFKFFFQWQILFASFRSENLVISRLGPLLGNQWQSSIFEESTSTSSFLKIFHAVFSKTFWSVLSGLPLISRHSHLKYCELFQNLCSKEPIYSFSLLLTCPATRSSESSLLQFCYRSERSCLKPDRFVFKVVSNLFW